MTAVKLWPLSQIKICAMTSYAPGTIYRQAECNVQHNFSGLNQYYVPIIAHCQYDNSLAARNVFIKCWQKNTSSDYGRKL